VLPKEKKQKEEKVQTYGQSVFELYSLLKGDLNHTVKLPVYPTPGSTLELQPPDAQLVRLFESFNYLIKIIFYKSFIFQPELEVQISIDQPILNSEESAKCNLVTVSLDAMYALPDSWVTSAREYAYTVSLPIPVNEDVNFSIYYIILVYYMSQKYEFKKI